MHAILRLSEARLSGLCRGSGLLQHDDPFPASRCGTMNAEVVFSFISSAYTLFFLPAYIAVVHRYLGLSCDTNSLRHHASRLPITYVGALPAVSAEKAFGQAPRAPWLLTCERSMTETSWLWLGTLGMLAGSILLFITGGSRTQDEEGHRIAHGLVPLFAAIAYFAMAIHQGAITLGGGREFLYARYIDWSVTTPVLLLGLSMTALRGAHRRAGLVAGLLVSDVVMILTGLFFGLSDDPVAKWTWYLTSCVAFLAVYYILLGPLRKEAMARDEARSRAYTRNMPVLGVLWLLYPIVVVLGPDGLGRWSPVLATACITILDLVAKVGYGLLSAAGSKVITDGDLSRNEVEAAPAPIHAVPSGAPRAARRA